MYRSDAREARMIIKNAYRQRPGSTSRRSRVTRSAAAGIALSIGLILSCSSRALAQGGGDDTQGAKSEYDRGYADGYKAGLRAAMTAAASASRSENAPPAGELKTLTGGDSCPRIYEFRQHGRLYPKSIKRCRSGETYAETGGGGPKTSGGWRSSPTVYRAVIGNTWR